jgi:hypothetical protein
MLVGIKSLSILKLQDVQKRVGQVKLGCKSCQKSLRGMAIPRANIPGT